MTKWIFLRGRARAANVFLHDSSVNGAFSGFFWLFGMSSARAASAHGSFFIITVIPFKNTFLSTLGDDDSFSLFNQWAGSVRVVVSGMGCPCNRKGISSVFIRKLITPPCIGVLYGLYFVLIFIGLKSKSNDVVPRFPELCFF